MNYKKYYTLEEISSIMDVLNDLKSIYKKTDVESTKKRVKKMIDDYREMLDYLDKVNNEKGICIDEEVIEYRNGSKNKYKKIYSD